MPDECSFCPDGYWDCVPDGIPPCVLAANPVLTQCHTLRIIVRDQGSCQARFLSEGCPVPNHWTEQGEVEIKTETYDYNGTLFVRVYAPDCSGGNDCVKVTVLLEKNGPTAALQAQHCPEPAGDWIKFDKFHLRLEAVEVNGECVGETDTLGC